MPGSLLLSVILVVMLAIAFHGWLQREDDRLRDWAELQGWRLLSPGPGGEGSLDAPALTWAWGEDWRQPKVAVAGWYAGYEIVVSWGETLSYAGLSAETAYALHLPGRHPDLRLRRSLPSGLTVHGDRLMIRKNGWARADDLLPAAGDLVAIADALIAASSVNAR